MAIVGSTFRASSSTVTVSLASQEGGSTSFVVKDTGVPVLLNTSLNIKSEPTICSPDDAIGCFFSTALDFLAMGFFIVAKCSSAIHSVKVDLARMKVAL